jgi:hypothetical protein
MNPPLSAFEETRMVDRISWLFSRDCEQRKVREVCLSTYYDPIEECWYPLLIGLSLHPQPPTYWVPEATIAHGKLAAKATRVEEI